MRALIGDDCRLDLVSKSQRRGKHVSFYFSKHKKHDVAVRVVRLEEQLALAAYVGGAAAPAYFMLLEFEAGRVHAIRDFRYIPYIVTDADYEIVAG